MAWLIPLGSARSILAQQNNSVPPQAHTATEEPPTPVEPVADVFALPLSDADAVEADRLIPGLGSPDYEERVKGTRGLVLIGAPVFTKLRHAYLRTDDFEIQSRIQDIVSEAYINHFVLRPFGFLGITRDAAAPTHADDPRIEEGHAGVKIRDVHPDTGAMRAGLRAGDVIIEMDGVPLPGPETEAFRWFSTKIRERGVGAGILLTLLRGEEQFQLLATLGPPLRSMIENGNLGRDIRDKLSETRDEFKIWWAKNFREAPPAD
jgi:hypothetical protein